LFVSFCRVFEWFVSAIFILAHGEGGVFAGAQSPASPAGTGKQVNGKKKTRSECLFSAILAGFWGPSARFSATMADS
jgi:hypothetical protein